MFVYTMTTKWCIVCEFSTNSEHVMNSHVLTNKHEENRGDKLNNDVIFTGYVCKNCNAYFGINKAFEKHKNMNNCINPKNEPLNEKIKELELEIKQLKIKLQREQEFCRMKDEFINRSRKNTQIQSDLSTLAEELTKNVKFSLES